MTHTTRQPPVDETYVPTEDQLLVAELLLAAIEAAEAADAEYQQTAKVQMEEGYAEERRARR